MMKDTQILLDIQRQIGELSSNHEEKFGKVYAELAHLKGTLDKTLIQATATNGKVIKLENVTVPEIREDISKRAKKVDCSGHSGTIKEIVEDVKKVKRATIVVEYLFAKPARFIAAIVSPAIIMKFIPDPNWGEFIGWVIKIF